MIRSMRFTLLALAGLLLAELGCSSDSAAPDSFVGQTVDAAVSPPPDAAPAGPTAYRITSLAVVDPRLWQGSGCTDFTDYVNSAVGSQITSGAIDGLIVFEPLSTASGTTTSAELIFGTCDATLLNCSASTDSIHADLMATSMASGACLDVIPGTLAPDSPPTIPPPMGPCFGATGETATLDLAGLRVDLLQVRIGAERGTETVPINLTKGLLYGFVTKAEAATLIVPGFGVSLDHWLRGGGSCADGTVDDSDTGPGSESGWYLYLTFTASMVSFVDNR